MRLSFLFWIAALSFCPWVWAGSDQPLDRRFAHSWQAGLEYDTNTLKVFHGSRGDALARLLFKSTQSLVERPAFTFGYDFQAGGKKYFQHEDQDTLIQSLELPVSWRPASSWQITLIPQMKVQEERDKMDQDRLDVNEDFWSPTGRMELRWTLPYELLLQPFAGITYFHFGPFESFRFYREWGGSSLTRGFGDLWQLALAYEHSRQQFEGDLREDLRNEFSVSFSHVKLPLITTRYAYQNTSSSQVELSHKNHKVSFLFSIPFGTRKDANTLFAFHLLATLQLKQFPSVVDYTEEGTRLLLTDSEDENFNSVVVKASCHPHAALAIEAKYARYSNELSSDQESFRRSLIYTGIRWSF